MAIQRSKLKGLTLIEVLTVVGVIAVILTIAIPAYSKFAIRSRVAEMLQLTANAKATMSEYILTYKHYPSDATQAGISPLSSPMVAHMDIDNAGKISMVADSSNLGVDLTITLQASVVNGSVIWTCASTGGVEYAPSSCRE